MSKDGAGPRAGALKRYGRAESGATAIEFAIVGGPFLYLLCVILEMGMMLFSEYAIEHATAQAARLVRTGQVQNGTMSAADFKQVVCDNVAFLDCDSKLFVDVRRYEDFASVAAPSSISTDGDGNKEMSDDITVSAQYDPGGPRDVIVVRVYYAWDLFVPGIPGMSGFSNLSNHRRLLSSAFAFQNEPYTVVE